MEPKFYTIDDLKRMFGVSRTTLYLWMDSGKLRYTRIGGRRRFTQEQLDAFIKSGENEQREIATPSLANA
jgi:excisionase family DNA binding protein